MNAKVLFFLLCPFAVSAQGFAGLGMEDDSFATPKVLQSLIFREIMARTLNTASNGGI